ncbi:MAG: hypothetical protein WC763_07280 [Candidatus Paceibacterota bacterium]
MKKPARGHSEKAPLRKEEAPAFDPAPETVSQPVPYVLDSPHAILDEALADAARTVALAAQGGEVSREQLAAAQDILNRKGITSASKTSAIPEAFARDAFSTVFRLLGFPPIEWPRTVRESSSPVDSVSASVDEFNRALADV